MTYFAGAVAAARKISHCLENRTLCSYNLVLPQSKVGGWPSDKLLGMRHDIQGT